MRALEGKVALVTGASAPHGIGRAIAVRLSQAGATVVATDLDQDMMNEGVPISRLALLEDLGQTITNEGNKAIVLPLDVTDVRDIEQCLANVRQSVGAVDILVNNAGSLSGSNNFLSTTPDQWRISFEVNILGPMMLAQAVIPDMRKAGSGRIINIGSTGTLGAEPGFGAYTAMKHGLAGFSKTIAAEFGPDGILCNTVCPGYIATDMHMAANNRLAAENKVTVAEMKARRYANVALRDAGLPQDVANAVAYLAGPEANYVTGINLPVTGGVPPGI